MKIWSFIIILFLFWGHSLSAQNEAAKNGIYLELLGNGIIYSVNYERFFNEQFSIRAGFGTFSVGGTFFFFPLAINMTTFPILGNYFYGSGSNKLELGAGVLLGSTKIVSGFDNDRDQRSTIFDLTAFTGYRYQNPNGGFIFRAGLTPFLTLSGGDEENREKGFALSGGISFGYAF